MKDQRGPVSISSLTARGCRDAPVHLDGARVARKGPGWVSLAFFSFPVDPEVWPSNSQLCDE